jgi:hypothetical protein
MTAVYLLVCCADGLIVCALTKYVTICRGDMSGIFQEEEEEEEVD